MTTRKGRKMPKVVWAVRWCNTRKHISGLFQSVRVHHEGRAAEQILCERIHIEELDSKADGRFLADKIRSLARGGGE